MEEDTKIEEIEEEATINDILDTINKSSDYIQKQFEGVNKRFEGIDKKFESFVVISLPF